MKRYIIRKYVMAMSAEDAIKRDKKQPVDDVWVDDKWLEEDTKNNFGFNEKKTRVR